jgi:hypothetical protein
MARLSSLLRISALALIFPATALVQAQTSHWATANDPTAKTLIELERKWAEAGCTHNGIEATILADDFEGTAPDGSLYDRQAGVADTHNAGTSERECVMYDVRVHFFGENMAILYGSESAIRKEADGHEHKRKLTWTDTWLKRNGKWQVVSAEDMPTDIK